MRRVKLGSNEAGKEGSERAFPKWERDHHPRAFVGCARKEVTGAEVYKDIKTRDLSEAMAVGGGGMVQRAWECWLERYALSGVT